MTATKWKQIAYWTTTLLVLLPTAGSGIPELLTGGPASTVEILRYIGYPLYLMKILGAAKIVGAITLLLNRPVRMVEWAYAGFAFLFLGATASHLLAGDAKHAPAPFILFLLLMASYSLYREIREGVGTQLAVHGVPEAQAR